MIKFPEYITVTVNKRIKLSLDDLDIEYFEREGFTDKEIENELEKDIRNNIWKHINDNDIKIIID